MSKHEHQAPSWTPQAKARAVPLVGEQMDSRDLFAASRVVTISHGDQVYQLRLTSQGKLILTK